MTRGKARWHPIAIALSLTAFLGACHYYPAHHGGGYAGYSYFYGGHGHHRGGEGHFRGHRGHGGRNHGGNRHRGHW